MADKSIKCPECGTDIEISTMLSQQIENDLKKENEQKLQKALADAQKKSLEEFSLEKEDLKLQLDEQKEKLEKAREKELDLKKQQRDLETKREQLNEEIETRLKKQEQVLRDQLEKKAKQATATEISDLQEQIREKDSRVEEAQKKELEIRKQARQLEEKQKNLDLEFQRKIDEERKEIEDKISKQFFDESNLKLKEKEKQINDLRKSLDDAKRKSEQGSMETQGEVLELDLEQRLRSQFVHDIISAVPKGIKGADIIQEVRDTSMNKCGKIIWEAKNTKNWSPLWLQKLKDDQREVGANMAILISIALPEGIKGFGMVEGVWVTDRSSSLPLASAIREQLIQVNFARSASQGKSEKWTLCLAICLEMSSDSGLKPLLKPSAICRISSIKKNARWSGSGKNGRNRSSGSLPIPLACMAMSEELSAHPYSLFLPLSLKIRSKIGNRISIYPLSISKTINSCHFFGYKLLL